MCGIAGVSYSDRRTFNLDKFKLLGCLNINRGVDSCGIFMQNLQKGAGSTKVFTEFIKQLDINVSKFRNGESFLIHTRAKTVGKASLENAHPFAYGKSKKNPDMIFTHNGTLEEIWDFSRFYNEKYSDFEVDSQLLGHLIYKHGAEKILSTYKGAAACAIYFPKTKDLYLWKGASKHKKSPDDVTEERPLHYYVDTKKKMVYYSSESIVLENTLRIPASKIKSVGDNMLIHIKSGEILEKKTLKREPFRYEPPTGKKTASQTKAEIPITLGGTRNKSVQRDLFNSLEEINPQNLAKGRAYYFNGRHWRNGHVLNGMEYINLKTAEFCTEKDYKAKAEVQKFYFHDGILCDGSEAYKSLKRLGDTWADILHGCDLGEAINFVSPSTMVKGFYYYYRNTENIMDMWITGEFLPLFSLYKFNFEDGKIKSQYLLNFDGNSKVIPLPKDTKLTNNNVSEKAVDTKTDDVEEDDITAEEMDAYNELRASVLDKISEVQGHVNDLENELDKLLHDHLDMVYDDAEINSAEQAIKAFKNSTKFVNS